MKKFEMIQTKEWLENSQNFSVQDLIPMTVNKRLCSVNITLDLSLDRS